MNSPVPAARMRSRTKRAIVRESPNPPFIYMVISGCLSAHQEVALHCSRKPALSLRGFSRHRKGARPGCRFADELPPIAAKTGEAEPGTRTPPSTTRSVTVLLAASCRGAGLVPPGRPAGCLRRRAGRGAINPCERPAMPHGDGEESSLADYDWIWDARGCRFVAFPAGATACQTVPLPSAEDDQRCGIPQRVLA